MRRLHAGDRVRALEQRDVGSFGVHFGALVVGFSGVLVGFGGLQFLCQERQLGPSLDDVMIGPVCSEVK